MKTPMQELIDILINERNQFIKMNPNQPIMDVGVKIFDVAISNAESLLDKEKEAIMDAWQDGRFDWAAKRQNEEDYYNKTFNTKETCTCKSAQFTREVTEDFEPMCGRCGRPI